MTVHVQAISKQLPASRAAVRHHPDQKTLNTLVSLLSYSLQVVVDSRDLTLEKPNTADAAQEMESGPPAGERDAKASLYGCTSDSNSVFKTSISTQQVVQLTDDILRTASDLILVREKKRCLHLQYLCLWTDINSFFFSEVHFVP